MAARLGVGGRREVGMLTKGCHRDAGDGTYTSNNTAEDRIHTRTRTGETGGFCTR